jgi:hypothetical protein
MLANIYIINEYYLLREDEVDGKEENKEIEDIRVIKKSLADCLNDNSNISVLIRIRE